jgi:DNA-binding Xre family transcriptional regulator
MITFEPLRQYLKSNKHNFAWLCLEVGIGKSTCTSLRNDKVVSLDIVEKICLKLNIEIQQVMQYRDDVTGETPDSTEAEPEAKTYSDTLVERNLEDIQRQMKIDRKKYEGKEADEISYLKSEPDFSPLFEILKDRGMMLSVTERMIGLKKGMLGRMKNGVKVNYENIKKLSDFLSVPSRQLYMDRNNPALFVKYENVVDSTKCSSSPL